MSRPLFRNVTPRLPVSDAAASMAFYRDVLGFEVTVAWPDLEPTFYIVERDGVAVGLVGPDEHRQRIGDVELYIEVSDALAVHAAVRDRVGVEWGPEVYSYGRREFGLRDPDGYLVIFTEPTDDPPTTHEPD